MSALANLTYDDNIANETDSVGGGFTIFPSSIYDAKIKLAYIQNSSDAKSKSTGINFTFDIDGKEYKETLWVTNKNGQNYYVDKNSGDKKYLGGFIHADAICLLAAKKALAQVATETKMVKIYNKDAGTDVPTKVEVLTDLTDQEIKLAILQQTVFKQQKNADNVYVDTDETRDENVIDKVFRAADSKTTAEIRAKAEEAAFHTIWSEKWEGKVKDRTKGKSTKKATGTAGAPAMAKVTSNLFDD